MHTRFLPRLRICAWVGWQCLCLVLGGWREVEGQEEVAPKNARRSVPSVTIQSSSIRCRITSDACHFDVVDKASKTVWESNPLQPRLGTITLRVGGREQTFNLANGSVVRVSPTSVEARYYPVPGLTNAGVQVMFAIGKDSRTIDVSCQADPALEVVSIRPLDDSLGISEAEHGYVILPIREGIMVPANNHLAYTNAFDTYAYEGCHMAMAGLVKNGAAVLLAWDDPNTVFELKSLWLPTAKTNQQILLSSLELRRTSKSFQIQFLGYGDYAMIAGAYRDLARRNGWLATWDDKIKRHPAAGLLLGAINFKLWSALDRRMSAAGDREESVKVNWTFDEAAQVAAHLKNDLKLDRVLFTIGGWIHRGYDNQHPDIMPAAPECGGNAGLAECARRVKELGYLFCLHDNYQDMYRDAPSWNEAFVMKHPDGSLAKGGTWAGGVAYLTCSQKALELARRTQNLEAVKNLTGANAYFIDTTFASGLQECFDPNHPLTRAGDMKWKLALADYAREQFGVFGSECGREWAIPHCDFFEGFTGVGGRSFHDEKLPGKLGGVVVPLFEMVYRDTIAMYGKYGYELNRSAEYVLSQMLLGRPLNYHDIPAHLYWRRETGSWGENPPVAKGGDPALFVKGAGGWTEGMHPLDRFVKNTYEVLSPLNELTAQLRVSGHAFLSDDQKVQRIIFGSKRKKMTVIVNAGAAEFQCGSTLGGTVVLPPYGFLIESPEFVAFHALTWKGIQYPSPVLFTLRSLDGLALTQSLKVRVYHGFGDANLAMSKGTVAVAREAVLDNSVESAPSEAR
jgi:hypothetical protein